MRYGRGLIRLNILKLPIVVDITILANLNTHCSTILGNSQFINVLRARGQEDTHPGFKLYFTLQFHLNLRTSLVPHTHIK